MSSGFGFGAKTTAAPAFGTGSITFGTPAAQPSQQFSFGSLASSSSNLFGTQTPSTASLSFGTPSLTTNTGFAFGAQNPVGTGFSFGAPASSAPPTGISFGAPASAAPSTGFGFSAAPTSSAPSTGFGFGTPASGTGLTFGTPASTASSGLGFKPAATGTGLTFGTSTSSLSFGPQTSTGSGLGFGTTTSSTGLTFGTPASTVNTGFSFGTASTSAPSLGLSFATTTTPGLGLGSTTSLGLTSTTTTTTQQNVGLGGVAFTQSKTGTTSTTQKELPPREQLLPNEFAQLVEQFKNVVQEEKNRSSEVARVSVKEFHKVENELDALNQQFNQLENELLNHRNLAEQLKYETAKGLQNIEMAQRTQETPPSLQYENTAPLRYFLDLADTFEREMQQLKLKIDNTEKYVKKSNDPNILTSQDLAVGLKRLNETFVALAGRMQAVHSQVETQKEIFLNMRKQILKDNSNPFEKIERNNDIVNNVMKNTMMKVIPSTLATGPTPFNSIALSSNNISVAAQQTQTPGFPAVATTTTTAGLGFGFGNTAPTFGTAPTNTSLFKPPGFETSSLQLSNTSSNFQLQKPPTGTKRGKQ